MGVRWLRGAPYCSRGEPQSAFSLAHAVLLRSPWSVPCASSSESDPSESDLSESDPSESDPSESDPSESDVSIRQLCGSKQSAEGGKQMSARQHCERSALAPSM